MSFNNQKKETTTMKKVFLSLLLPIALVACNSAKSSSPSKIDDSVITKEQQANLTPDDVIKLLEEGNQRFVNNDLTQRDHTEEVRKAVEGQFPKAIILSCVDSRVPVEDVFDLSIGDIFVARVAGNFVNEDILGSMEFATKVAGSKLIMVMGHEHCGAVKASIDNVELGNITSLVENIRPAVEKAELEEGEKTSKNPEFVHQVCYTNVVENIKRIRAESEIANQLEKEGKIKIVGGLYDMDTAEVRFITVDR